MADKRIIELEERLTLEKNDYLASDNTNGTCKVNAGIITNQFSDMQNKLGAKNLLKNGLTSRTTSGLTITVNSNGSILINGTAAADVSLTLVQNFTLAAGEYILSGVGSDAPGIGLSLNASYGGNTVTCNKDNTQKHFTLSSDSNITNVNMSITAGLAFTNYTLYPMIRPASVADEAFIAFEKTNAQLTKELGDPSTASAVSGSDAFGKIASLNNDLSDKQDKLIDSGWKNLNTSYTAKYRKVGKAVEIIISTGTGINPSGTAASVGTLDEGFRPEYNLTVPMNFGATGNVLGYLSITASTGKVSSIQNSGSNQQYGNCNTMYFVP